MNTIPIIITTWEGLLDTMPEAPPVIYIDFCLFTQNKEEIHTVLSERSYHRFHTGKHGVFFALAGNGDITILDPQDIL